MDERLEAGRTLEALRRKNLEGKKTFIEELRRQKNPKSVSLLLEILCDESWYLRDLAFKALVESGALAVEPLRGVLASGLWYTRAAAARALGELGDGRSAGDMLGMLTDANHTVRDAGLQSLKALASRGQAVAIARAIDALPPESRGPCQSLLQQRSPDLAQLVENAAQAARAQATPANGEAAPRRPLPLNLTITPLHPEPEDEEGGSAGRS